MRRGVILLLLFLIASPMTVSAQLTRHWGHTKPGSLPGIPSGNYQYRPRSPSIAVISKRAVLVRKSTIVTEERIEAAAKENPRPGESELQPQPERPEELPSVTPQPSVAPRVLPFFEQPTSASDGQAHREVPKRSDERGVRRFANFFKNPFKRRGEQLPVADDSRHSEDVLLRPVPTPSGTVYRAYTPASSTTEQNTIKTIHLYQLEQPRLKIDHCSISQVALQLHNDGKWVLSLRGDQNKRPDDPENAPYNPSLYIKRNQFVVRLRCFGNFVNEPPEGELTAGKPVLAQLQPVEFWVENGQPRHVYLARRDPLVRHYFDMIDRVEVEFFYRKGPGQTRLPQ